MTFILTSIAGAVFAVFGTAISAIFFEGRNGEAYSPLNHFISELGEVGVSRLARVFNLGVILCGFCLIPACINLGLLLPRIMSTIGMVAGVITALGISMVGIYPMNRLKPHVKAAMGFFRGGLLMVLAFSVAIAFQQGSDLVLPRGYSLAGLPTLSAFGSFLVLMRRTSVVTEDPFQPTIDE